jgi:hypothetical protein
VQLTEFTITTDDELLKAVIRAWLYLEDVCGISLFSGICLLAMFCFASGTWYGYALFAERRQPEESIYAAAEEADG